MPLFQPGSAASGPQLARIERKLDAVLAALGVSDIPESPMDAELRRIRSEQGPIQAIKRCRELTGWGLSEAKDYVESL